jgi:hypothetical protein
MFQTHPDVEVALKDEDGRWLKMMRRINVNTLEHREGNVMFQSLRSAFLFLGYVWHFYRALTWASVLLRECFV